MIIFNDKRMSAEWPLCHPELRGVLIDFDHFSTSKGLPNPVFTDVVRYRPEQREIYFKHWKQLLEMLALKPASLSLAERQQALELRAKTDAELYKLAEQRFTWHLVRCAVDLRTVGPDPEAPHYKPSEMNLVIDFFRTRTPRPLWEFLVHDVHGPHMHIGRRDFSWRQKYANPPPPAGAA